MTKNPESNKLFKNAKNWVEEANLLRKILLECNLTEEIKWRSPCYAYNGKNICIIQRMASFLSLLFFKGVLLKDPDDLLTPQGPHSRVGYWMCFTNVEDILTAAKSIKAYVQEAIEIEKVGLKIGPQNDFIYPVELVEKFDADPEFKTSFNDHSPGLHRGYITHVSGAKQSKARTARIEKCRQNSLTGKDYLDGNPPHP